jgi:Peptidase family M48
MSTPSPILEPEWLAWYKQQLPKAANVSRQLKSGVTTAIIALTGLPLFGLVLMVLAAEELGRDSASVPAVLGMALLAAAAYAACDIGQIRLFGLDRYVIRAAPARIIGFLIASQSVYALLTVLQAKAGMPGGVSFTDGESGEILGLMFAAMQVLLSRAFLFIYLSRKYRESKACFDPSHALPIPNSPESQIWPRIHHILEAASHLGLPKISVSAWLLRTDGSAMPSLVTVRKGKEEEHRLIIPRCFLVDVLPQGERANAILAHELSHAFQRDVELWSRSDLFYVVMTRVLVPQFAIIGALGLVFAVLNLIVSGSFTALSGAALPIVMSRLLYGSYTATRKARRESEHVADLFASGITSSETMIEAIQMYAGEASPLHPSRDNRIEYLSKPPGQASPV